MISQKTKSIIVICVGILLLIVGLFLKTPSKDLTTLSLLSNTHSVIEEYVGGDAYNYIIGAALVGGDIAGTKTQKAIFICVGTLIICIGFLFLKSGNNSEKHIINNINTSSDNLKLENAKVSNNDTGDELSQQQADDYTEEGSDIYGND